MSISLLDYTEEMARSLKALPLLREEVDLCIKKLIEAAQLNKPILIAGNGGSATDASHMAAELVGRFLKNRKALFAINLSSDNGIVTAVSNDYGYETVFARQVEAYGQEGGVFIGLSTSGSSKNVINATKVARCKKMFTCALTGEGGGDLLNYVDLCIRAPSASTSVVQQCHQVLYHYICFKIEESVRET